MHEKGLTNVFGELCIYIYGSIHKSIFIKNKICKHILMRTVTTLEVINICLSFNIPLLPVSM